MKKILEFLKSRVFNFRIKFILTHNRITASINSETNRPQWESWSRANVLGGLFLATFIFLSNNKVLAVSTYNSNEVSKHNVETDCWMSFEDKVYNVTAMLIKHDQFLDIRSWCGQDMTTSFKTKNNQGIDHSASAYEMLTGYEIGILDNTKADSTTTTTSKPKSPYNFVVPFVTTLTTYLISFYLLKRKWLTRKIFNMIWNTMLLITLIPSAIFGFYMVLSYSYPLLREVKFNFLYWHVEGSVMFGLLAVVHFINRFTQYQAQLKPTGKSKLKTIPLDPVKSDDPRI